MTTERDPFAQLGLEPRFALDPAELDRRQRELYVEHRTADPSVLESLNEAVRWLKDPVARAERLFSLRGWSTKGSQDLDLLERVFAEREFIDAARKRGDAVALQGWLDAAQLRRQKLLGELTELLDGPAIAQTASNVAAQDGAAQDGAAQDGAAQDGAAQDGAAHPANDRERAWLRLEELRYFGRALASAHAALEALEP